jgi:hypothetical protein
VLVTLVSKTYGYKLQSFKCLENIPFLLDLLHTSGLTAHVLVSAVEAIAEAPRASADVNALFIGEIVDLRDGSEGHRRPVVPKVLV